MPAMEGSGEERALPIPAWLCAIDWRELFVHASRISVFYVCLPHNMGNELV